jgi:hypothetical protein
MSMPQEPHSMQNVTGQMLVRDFNLEGSSEQTTFDALAYSSNDKLFSQATKPRSKKKTSVLMTSKFAAKHKSMLQQKSLSKGKT